MAVEDKIACDGLERRIKEEDEGEELIGTAVAGDEKVLREVFFPLLPSDNRQIPLPTISPWRAKKEARG